MPKKQTLLFCLIASSLMLTSACDKSFNEIRFSKPKISLVPAFANDLKGLDKIELDDESRVLFDSLNNKCTDGKDDACMKLASIYTSDYNMRSDTFAKGIELYSKQCDKGFAKACSFLAKAYSSDRYGIYDQEVAQAYDFRAKSVAKVNFKKDFNTVDYIFLAGNNLDEHEMTLFYKDMCEKGNLDACKTLRVKYEDLSESLKEQELLKKHCDKLDGASCRVLGERLFEIGKYEQAKNYLLIALGLNDKEALIGLSKVNLHEQNKAEAVENIKKSCLSGVASACTILANIFINKDLAQEYDVKANKFTAAVYQDKACYYGDGFQCLILSDEYLKGYLWEVNESASRRYFMRVINQNLLTCEELFKLYEQPPPPSLREKLIITLKRGCLINGDSKSCTTLADAYRNAKYGLIKDFVKAQKLLEYSCNEHDAKACYTLLTEY